jgi:hypothetical protein
MPAGGGSLQLGVTYSDFRQYVDAAINVSSLDLTAKTLHAFVMLDSGPFNGGVQLHAGSGPSYAFAASTYTSFRGRLPQLDRADARPHRRRELGQGLRRQRHPADRRAVLDRRSVRGGTIDAPFDVVFHIDSITAQ